MALTLLRVREMALPEIQPIYPFGALEAPVPEPSIKIRVGSRFTRAVHASDDRLITSRVLPHSPVLLAASQAEAAHASGAAAARLVRAAARQVAERAGLESLALVACPVIGVGGIAREVITLGAGGRTAVTIAELQSTTETLAVAWVTGQRGRPFRGWVDPVLIGAAVLEATLEFLDVDRIAAEESRPDPTRA